MSTFRFLHLISAVFGLMVYSAVVLALFIMTEEAGHQTSNIVELGVIGSLMLLLNIALGVKAMNQARIY